jgi:uncharacterized zinc-type alcohol dehydrogenase-like protein
MKKTIGYATSQLAPFSFERRNPLPTDIQIEILFCGVCHSDIHQVRNEWGNSTFPMVPGHEIVGKVIQRIYYLCGIGNDVKEPLQTGSLAVI